MAPALLIGVLTRLRSLYPISEADGLRSRTHATKVGANNQCTPLVIEAGQQQRGRHVGNELAGTPRTLPADAPPTKEAAGCAIPARVSYCR